MIIYLEGARLGVGDYTIGQEVTIDNEKFFVLEDEGDEVKLLAKYCLNNKGTEQINEGYSIYGKKFSKESYWANDFASISLDLQSSEMITKAKTDGQAIVLTAMNYGKTKRGIGRLMSYEEANSIVSSSNQTLKDILLGGWTGEGSPTQGFLRFWLGTATSVNQVAGVLGDGSNKLNSIYWNNAGLRNSTSFTYFRVLKWN